MKDVLWPAGAVCLLGVASLTWMGASTSPGLPRVERGKYLVHGVAECGDCHTPVDGKGAPVTGKEFHGAPILFKPTVAMPAWAEKAPDIAGLPG